MAWNRIGNLAVFSLAFIFAACGGDSGSNGKTETDGSSQAETFDDLPNCSKNREGEIIAVVDGRKTYICSNGRWEELGTAYENADDLPNCSDKRDGSTAYVVADKESLICSDGKWENSSSQSQNQEGNLKDELKSSSSNKHLSSSSVEKNSKVSSSSESKVSSSRASSSSVAEKPVSSAAQSSSSVKSTIEYGTLTDERDGQKYKTVKIGEQTWMAENLNFDYKIEGKRYGSYCYNDEPDSCAIYGRLYTFATAMDSAALFSDDGKGCGANTACGMANAQGICPENWHLPSVDDWYELFTVISEKKDFKSIDATSLKSIVKWKNNGEGTDQFGFSILPAGGFYSGSALPGNIYRGEGGIAFFWMNGTLSPTTVQVQDSVYIYGNNASEAYSVRCVKNTYKELSHLYIDVKDRETFEIPANTVVTATMPKCGYMSEGTLSCTAKGIMNAVIPCHIVKIGDIEKNTRNIDVNVSKEFVSSSCGKGITITSTGTAQCVVDFY